MRDSPETIFEVAITIEYGNVGLLLRNRSAAIYRRREVRGFECEARRSEARKKESEDCRREVQTGF